MFTDSDFWANAQRSPGDIWYISILGIQCGFFACTEISSDFHNLFMIFCNVDDEIFKFFEIVHWRTLFWNLKICLFLFIRFFCRFLNHCQFSLLRNAASQRCSFFFTTKHVIDLLPVNLISLQLFLFCTAHFSCSFFFFYWLYLKKVENHITAIKFKDV